MHMHAYLLHSFLEKCCSKQAADQVTLISIFPAQSVLLIFIIEHTMALSLLSAR